MRVYFAFFASFVFTAIVVYGFLYFRDKNKAEVLGYISDISPTIPPTLTPTLVPTNEPTVTPSMAPTFVPTLKPTPEATIITQPHYSSEQINAFIERFAGQYGVDPNVLRHIAVCESGFNASSVNGPYVGLYQFSSNTWINNRSQMGEITDPELRYDAEEAVQTAAYLISIGKKGIWPNCYP
ncbi:hypothetical protein A2863_02275 [Candidatus Woesebacteria bacterium RIFCSPHIGHO2_01_FULL_38_9b]|uniref:Transglycosylase SLT domain-containing protein n=1 Tax=Candidatus Woesebacteria bacterium RIFCSPHIGHO2_01_FULL_38_9b TaxID=1802493 RepID=A0A1F7Y3N9_9BACT|nr:MAG: hypothetical protein A2863_02275 [Candidatus Woesebacteria bacterium RIFCSPHIGHO2_01_FULL_38_9b]